MLRANEIVVDNFAGGGGASLGIEQALGRPVDVAINHDALAVAMHLANHPDTRHLCEDVWDADPREVAAGRPVGLAWFSPDCKHFSKAKGGKPVEKKIRGLAWVVIRWAATVKPRIIILENVEEFQTWGPLVDDRPCRARKGRFFRIWVNQLRKLGYAVEWRELRACDYGTPTIRKRLFLIARRDGEPIVWPAATHGPGKTAYRTAAGCIDWSIPCPSIFERKRPLAEATMRRIARGIRRFVIDAAEPFIVPVTHQGDDRCHPTNEPLRTVTTASRGEMALVAAHLQRQFGKSTGQEADAPAPTVTAGGGGKTALVAAFMAQHNGGPRPMDARPVDKPMSTLTVSGSQQQVAAAHLLKLRGTSRDGQPVDEPSPTVTASGTHLAEVRAFLVKYYGTASGQDLFGPLHSVTTKHRFGLVTVAGVDYQIVDIGMRMLQPRELFRAQGFPDSYLIDPLFEGKHLTKTAQVRMCGNSVCPPVAQAVVEANFAEAIARPAQAETV